MEIDSRERMAAADREVKLGVAELGAKVDRLQLFMEESQLVGSRAHEAGMAAADAGHDEHMAQLQHQQGLDAAAQGLAGQAALSDQGHAQTLEQGQQGHTQALEQGQQAADLAPPPPEPTGAQE
jgi:hypothetical protein